MVWACIPGTTAATCSSSLKRQGGPGGAVRLPDPDPPEKAHRGLLRQGPLVAAFLLEEDLEMAVYSTEGRCVVFPPPPSPPRPPAPPRGSTS